MASDEREIRTVHSIWIDAVNAGDLARLLTLVAEDVVFLTPGQAPFGRRDFRPTHGRPPTDADLLHQRVEEVVVVGEVAYTRSRDSLSVTRVQAGRRHSSPGIA